MNGVFEMTLDHIALIVSREENLSFYEQLGFKETKRIERSYDTVVFMENDGIVLEVFCRSEPSGKNNRPEAKGLRHIAFCVDSLDDLKLPCEEIRTDWLEEDLLL